MPIPQNILLQEGWKVTLVGSRFTHPAESRYAPIEGEALAVADALDKARHFVLGCSDLVIAVDHKPLLKLFGDRSLEDIPNTRLCNLKEKTLRYRFRMVHIPGTRNKTSDTLSRHPSGMPSPARMNLPDDNTAPDSACPNHSPRIPTTLLAGISITHPTEVAAAGLATALPSQAYPSTGRHSRSPPQQTIPYMSSPYSSSTGRQKEGTSCHIHSGLLPLHPRPLHSRRSHLPRGQDRYPDSATTCLPRCTPCSSPRRQQDDRTCRSLHILARDNQRYCGHQRQMRHMQWQCPLSTRHAIHHTSGTPLPIPAHMRGLLPPPRGHLPGPCGPLLQLASCHHVQRRRNGPHPDAQGHVLNLRDT